MLLHGQANDSAGDLKETSKPSRSWLAGSEFNGYLAVLD
jgi:hypothetical protein